MSLHDREIIGAFLLDPEQRVVGVGFCANPDDPSGNRLYWTMIVTRPAL